jgi:transcriptional regulator with XRE-family HTH domain
MSADEATAFGHRLRELREQAGLTQGQLAERAAMHRQGIVKLERGEREPSWSTLLALAKALDLDLNAFAQSPESNVSPRGPGRPPKPTSAATEAPATPSPQEEPTKSRGKAAGDGKKPRGRRKGP